MKYILSTILALTSVEYNSTHSLYDIKLKNIDGFNINFNDFKGKNIIFVNVASRCGFTKQYSELEKLHQKYKDNLIIIGIPCNQFGSQEPGTEIEIKKFCVKNFGVSFILTEKILVKGNNMHPLYRWLTQKELNGKFNSNVKWNFQKYFVDREGNLIDYFYSTTNPLSKKITSLIK